MENKPEKQFFGPLFDVPASPFRNTRGMLMFLFWLMCAGWMGLGDMLDEELDPLGLSMPDVLPNDTHSNSWSHFKQTRCCWKPTALSVCSCPTEACTSSCINFCLTPAIDVLQSSFCFQDHISCPPLPPSRPAIPAMVTLASLNGYKRTKTIGHHAAHGSVMKLQ